MIWPILRALGQKPDQVVIRRPGDRFLSAPLPIKPYAEEHWQYAWLAVAAYGKTPAGRKDIARLSARLPRPRNAASPEHLPKVMTEPDAVLEAAGWTCWKDFPNPDLNEKFRLTHLRAEVWQKRSRSESGREMLTVAIIFGGTVFDNEQDWRANLRWLLPKWLTGGKLDEYSAVVHELIPAFITHFKGRVSGEKAAATQLIATGHSLGGGLAQQFAYALSLDPEVPRVSQVYAFDPSPVTGFYSVEPSLRDANKQNLKTDRIYERGEILALLRSLTSLLVKPSAMHPTIRGVRYCLFYTWNPIASHSILTLASKLYAEIHDPQGAMSGEGSNSSMF